MLNIINHQGKCKTKPQRHYHFTSTRMAIIKRQISVNRGVENWNPRTLLSRRSVVSDSAAPQLAACQIPLSTGFPRQEYWSRLSLPTSGDPPDPGIKPTSLVSPALAGGFLTTTSTWKAPEVSRCG